MLKLNVMVTPCEIFGSVLEGRIALKGKPSRHFAFCELDPVSPLPQPANYDSFFLRSLKERRRTTNRNPGLRHVLSHIRSKYYHRSGWRICITPVFGNESEDIVKDYEKVYSLFYDFVDMFCIDTTICDAEGRKPLENIGTFTEVLDSLLNLRRCYDDHKPVFVRVSPEVDRELLGSIVLQCRMGGVEAVMVGCGGRGRKKLESTVMCVGYLKELTLGRYPIIACIHSLRAEDVQECIKAGASLVQAEHRRGYTAARIDKLWRISSLENA